jgi:predicted ribosomally synthesized peptide with SipW-like signal peptide
MKKLLLSLVTIGATGALLIGVTRAYFSDQGTSSNNIFSTGTLILGLRDGNEQADTKTLTATFGNGTLVPGTNEQSGACTGDQTLTLKNTGTIAANHAEIHLANLVTDVSPTATPSMDSFLRIYKLEYDGTSVLNQIPVGSNSFADLADWATNATALDNLSLTNLNTDHHLVMNVCLDSSGGNDLQGDSVNSTFTVDLNQDVTQ